MGSRGKTNILKDAVMKRHATMSLRRKNKIYTIIIKTKMLSNTRGVLEISKVMIVTKITLKTRGEMKLFMVVLHSEAVMVREVGIMTLMV